MVLIPQATPAAVNRCKNPSAETNLAGVTMLRNGGSGDLDRTTDNSWVGTYSFHMGFTSASSGQNAYMYWGTSASDSAIVSPGESIDVVVRYWVTSAALGAQISGVDWYDASYTHLGNSGETTPFVYGVQDSWRVLELRNQIAPANAAYVRVYVSVRPNAAVTNQHAYIDGMHIAPSIDAYVDGAQGTGYAWDGTAHNSSSRRREIGTQGPTGSGGELTFRARYYAADRNNRLGDDISAQILAGSLETDIDRAIQSTVKLTALSAEAVSAWSWVAVFVETTSEDGTINAVQRGLFRLGQPKISGDETSATVEVSGEDVTALISNYAFTDTYNIPVGTNVTTAIVNLLALAGITRHAIPDTSRVTGKARSFNPGDTLRSALSSLTEAMGWYSVYPMPDGRITTRPYRALDTTMPTRTYALGERTQLVGEIITSRDDSSFANVVIAVRSDPTLGVLKATARNDDPRSPASTTYPGGAGVVTKVITVNNADIDQDTLTRTASEGLASSSIIAAGTITTLPDLELDVHDVVQLTADTTLYPHLAQANGSWYVQRISQGLDASSATTTIQMRRSEVL